MMNIVVEIKRSFGRRDRMAPTLASWKQRHFSLQPVSSASLRLTKKTRLEERVFSYGAMGNRTPDLFIANETLYQLSYGPVWRRSLRWEWAIQDLNL